MATLKQGSLARHTVRGIHTRIDALRPTAAALAVAACFASVPALANPVGGTTVHGTTAAISNPAANILQIQTFSDKTIMNWQSFSIGANELTKIMQPTALSALLNRVGKGSSPSEILGALQSNGRVFLINPNGITFGPNSQIDVAGFVASTLNMSNDDFLGGRMHFTRTAGAQPLVNEGVINAAHGGSVYLVGPALKNSGIITAPGGEVVLAAGNSVELVNPGTPNLRVEINARDNQALNLGQIVADSGRVGIYAGLIDQKGTIRADSAVAGEDGRILLKATKKITLDADSVTSASGSKGGRIEVNAGGTTLVEGTVAATGAKGRGGVVHLLGDQVGVYGDARVDASGKTRGGTVLVGGAFQGKPGVTAVERSEIHNATAVFFGEDASISADAVASGNGGKIILWSDDTTRSYGALSARGGAASGNGGLVETSGKHGLEVTRGPDLRAPHGIGGTWLVDPNDLEVVAGTEITNNTAQPLFSSLDGSSKIGVELINLQLNFGSNVLLTTTDQGIDSGQQGNITVSAPILKTASGVGHNTITMQAHNDIVINGAGGVGIASTGDPLSVNLIANGDGVGGGGVAINAGILTNGGSLFAQGSGLVAINAPVSTITAAGTSGGSIFLRSLADKVRIGEAMASDFSFFASGVTGVEVNAPIATLNNSLIQLASSAGPITVDAAVTGGQFFASSATGVDVNAKITALGNNPITLLGGAGAVTVDASLTGGSVSASGAAGVDVNARITAPFGTTLSSSSGPVTVAGAIEGGFFSATAGAGELLTISAPVTATGATLTADDMQIQDTLSSTGSVFVRQSTFNRPMNIGTNTPGSLSLSVAELGRLQTSGTLTLGDSSTGAVTVSAAITNPGGPSTVSLNSGSTISIDSAITLGGNLSTNSGTSTTIGAPLTAGGSINASAGTTIITNAAVNAGGNVTADAGTSITTGAVVNAGGNLSANSPTISIGAAVNAGRVTFTADNLVLNGLVTSGSDIDIFTRQFNRQIQLGVSSHDGSALQLTETEINNRLVTNPAGTLRIGNDSSGKIELHGDVQPAGTNTLVLQSRGAIVDHNNPDETAGTITIANLGLRARGNVDFSQDNAVDTLAASTTGSGQTSFEFTNEAGRKLTIGTVDGIFGVNNFVNGATGTIIADKLDLSQQLRFDTVIIRPRSPGTVGLDLGGDDTVTRLGISVSDLSFIVADTLNLKANTIDISNDVAPNANTLVLSPLQANRQLNIVAAPKNDSNLEFLPSELERVSVSNLTLGDSNTGAINVGAAVDLTAGPGNVGTFTLRTGDPLGITVAASSTVRANNLTLIADAMDLNSNVRAVSGDLKILQNGDETPINLGSSAGAGSTLNLSPAETDRLFASGTLFIGNSLTGNVDVTEGIIFTPAQLGSLNITSGGTIHVHEVNGSNPRLEAPGSITLIAPTIDIHQPVISTVSGDIRLIANTLTVNDEVRTTGSDILVRPLDFRNIHLGADDAPGVLGLTASELDNFHTPAGGVLRIGDPNFTFTTGDIVVKSAIAPANVSTLSLITRDGSISQDTGVGATITIGSLAAQASGSVTLDQGNTVNNVALVAEGGDVRFTHAGGGVLKVANVDGVQGIFSDENVHIIANRLDIDSNINADGVFIAPITAGRQIGIIDSGDIKAGGLLELFNTEIGRISARSITLGDTNTGNITVATPLSFGSTDLNLIAGDTRTITVDASVTASNGNLTFTGGAVGINAGVSATDGSGDGRITVTADQMTFAQNLIAGDRITLRPLTLTDIELGGPGVLGEVLGLSANSLSKLSANSIIIGNSGMTSIVSNDAITLSANSTTLQTGASGSITLNDTFNATGNLTLTTGNSGTINVNDTVTAGGNLTLTAGTSGSIGVSGALNSTGGNLFLNTGAGGMVTVDEAVKAFGTLSLTTDNLTLTADSDAKLSGANVTLSTATSGRNVDFGAAGGPTSLGLDVDELGRIATPGTFTVNANGSSTLTVSAVQLAAYAVGPDTGVNNLSLSADTINVAGALGVPGDITLRANAMDIGSNVRSTGDAVITVTPRSFTNMTLGSGGGSGLQLSAQEIGRLRTGGALRLGAFGFVNSLTIDDDITINAANVGSLTLTANNTISQTSGSIITADRLLLQSSTIDLQEANRVGTLSGSAFNTTFVNDGTLTIGTVDGAVGFASTFLTLKADNLVLANGISGSSVTLAPRSAGDAMNLGSNPGGGFGISAGELDKITSFNVTFGDTTTGNVTVSANMERAAGTLNIVTGASKSVDVNGRLAAQSGVGIDSGDINVSAPITASAGNVNLLSHGATVKIDAAISGNNGVTVDAGTIKVSAPVTASSGQVNLTSRGVATLNIDSTVSGAFGVNLISDVTNIDAAVRSDFGTVTIAPFSGGREVNLGTKTSGALSLTAGELAHIDAPAITIGSSTAGALTVSAPVSVSTFQLNLKSGGSITQTAKDVETNTPGTPIILTKLDGNGLRSGSLDVVAGGLVDLRAANEVPGIISGNAANRSSDFLFNNELGMKLQNVFVAPTPFLVATGKVRINSGLFIPLLPVIETVNSNALAQVVDALDQVASIGGALIKTSDDKKDDKKKSVCD